MTTALINGRVLMADVLPSGNVNSEELRSGFAVLIADGRIVEIVADSDPRVCDALHHDLGGRYLVPGFIDCQVNGGGGVLFNDAPTVETIRRIGAAHSKFGTTGFLPTLISDDSAVMRAALTAVDQAIADGVPGVLGIHLEGPFLSAQRSGIHNAEKFHDPDSGDIDLVCSLTRGKTLLTLAPERTNDTTLRKLAARGIIVAAGHTAADYATTYRALAAGLRGFTHLFNAMTPLGSREPGVVGAALDDEESWCGLIVDGHHVHPATLRVALAAKARGKMFLVTDAMPPVGAAHDSFILNGETITCRDGRCVNAAGTIAGSSLDMATAVRNCVEQVGLSLAEAARMAATYPAAFLGIGHTHGRIASGYAANFVVLNEDLRVHETWIGGERC